MLSVERLREVLHFDENTGTFRWRINRGPARKGNIAGNSTTHGYRRIRIDWVLYKEHSLAWLYVNGQFPDGEIDHVNGITSYNRPVNLRIATHTMQMANSKKRKDNKSGFKGVFWNTRAGRWEAKIQFENRQHHLGYFDDASDAHVAYCAAAIKHWRVRLHGWKGHAMNENMPNQVAVFRHELQTMEPQFAAALPPHITVARFARVLQTAIQNNPDLLYKCDRRSLWNSAMKCAQDGLVADNREAAIVVYGDQAQYLPMIAGLRKKARNSGEIATWDAQVVHAKDQFEFELGDTPFIRHRPCLDEDPGPVIAAYSVALLKSGEKSREVMSVYAIEKVRARSRAKKGGPWFSDYEEMCRKSVARRHSKVLPTSVDIDTLLQRDDDLYDLKSGAGDAAIAGGDKHKTLAGRLDALAGPARETALASREQQGGDEGAGASEAPAPAPAADIQPPAAAQAPGSASPAMTPAAEPEARPYRPGTGSARLSDLDVGE